MRVTFAGAAETVTGSCHYVETAGGRRLVLDCGMFQGLPEIEARNRQPFPFDPASLDFVLLSHAHLDHTGRLPLLVKAGFQGTILATSATHELARLILLDSAHIQESDAERARRKGILDKDEGRWAHPLYGQEDVYAVLQRFAGQARYDEAVDLGGGLSVTYRDAGHVVGSAFLEIAETRDGATRRLTFSGDLGNVDKPIVRDPSPRRSPADLVLLESTYGDREHRPFAESVAELGQVVRRALAGGACVVIPAFALERSQELLYVLSRMAAAGELDDARVYLDSPMAIEVTEVVGRHPEDYDEELLAMVRRGDNPFHFANVQFTRDVEDSKRINQDPGPCLIVAASGMCTGGRVLHHLLHRAQDPRNAICFIGYQAEGTLGRAIVNGAKEVHIYGQTVPVRATCHTINGFSGHAGQHTLLDWLGSAESGRTYLVHGEKGPIQALRGAIKERFGADATDADFGAHVDV